MSSRYAAISGKTIVASDSMMKRGVSTSSLPQVIFSFGRRAAVRAVRGRRLGDLAEVAPERDVSRRRSWCISGTTQIGKSPAMPPPIWKKPSRRCLVGLLVPVDQRAHVLDAALHDAAVDVAARCTAATNMLPSVESSQPGHEDRQVLLRGGEQPRVLRIDLVLGLELGPSAAAGRSTRAGSSARPSCARPPRARASAARSSASPLLPGCRCR